MAEMPNFAVNLDTQHARRMLLHVLGLGDDAHVRIAQDSLCWGSRRRISSCGIPYI